MLTNNIDTIMASIGVTKNDSAYNLMTSLYNKLQGGDIINAELSDGAKLEIAGQFSDDRGQWHFDFNIKLPETSTSAIFSESNYNIKGGSLRIVTDSGEITKVTGYGSVIGIYGYKLYLSGVEVSNGVKKFKLDIDGLQKTDDGYDYGMMIDPDRADWSIKIQEFLFPEDDAPGIVKVDGQVIAWKDVKALLKV